MNTKPLGSTPISKLLIKELHSLQGIRHTDERWENGKSEKMVRVMTHNFYRQLTRNGFSSKEVIQAASELIQCINKSFK
jgi:hypothetical protein